MDFNEKEVDEYVSSSDEEEQKQEGIQEERKGENESDVDFSQRGDARSAGGRAGSLIFKPFKPGKQHDALRQIPLSVQEIYDKKSLFSKN